MTELLIRTDTLRKILEEEPAVKLQLQHTAIEKIAEELTRKAKHLSLAQFESQLQTTVNKAISEFNKDLTSKYRFPAEAKVIIEQIAREYVERMFNGEKARLTKEIDEYFRVKQEESDKKTEAAVLIAIEKMRPTIKQQARTEFVEVLQQVQGAAR
jgi:hypothetical protein